jgi:serine/threonine protein kinase
MLSDNDEIKLVDFGLSKINESKGKMMKTVCGTPYYMAPELLKRVQYDT